MKPRLSDWAWCDCTSLPTNGKWFQLEEFKPKVAGDFCIFGKMYIGSNEGSGEDTFELSVCTPKWFAENAERAFKKSDDENIAMGRHYLFVKNYDGNTLTKFIKKYLEENCEGTTWKEVSGKIGRLAWWEFEDQVDMNKMNLP